MSAGVPHPGEIDMGPVEARPMSAARIKVGDRRLLDTVLPVIVVDIEGDTVTYRALDDAGATRRGWGKAEGAYEAKSYRDDFASRTVSIDAPEAMATARHTMNLFIRAARCDELDGELVMNRAVNQADWLATVFARNGDEELAGAYQSVTMWLGASRDRLTRRHPPVEFEPLTPALPGAEYGDDVDAAGAEYLEAQQRAESYDGSWYECLDCSAVICCPSSASDDEYQQWRQDVGDHEELHHDDQEDVCPADEPVLAAGDLAQVTSGGDYRGILVRITEVTERLAHGHHWNGSTSWLLDELIPVPESAENRAAGRIPGGSDGPPARLPIPESGIHPEPAPPVAAAPRTPLQELLAVLADEVRDLPATSNLRAAYRTYTEATR